MNNYPISSTTNAIRWELEMLFSKLKKYDIAETERKLIQIIYIEDGKLIISDLT